MKFIINKTELLASLQQVIGAIERRQTQAILSNVLIKSNASQLTLTATDLEIELISRLDKPINEQIEITLPGRKLFDITKALPDECDIEFSVEENQVTLKAAKSRFVLASLPANDFPVLDEIKIQSQFEVPQNAFKRLLEKTSFAMAQQDVRYYLNGILMEIETDGLRLVATDGHRLALSECKISLSLPTARQIIVPRKGVMELSRLLQNTDQIISVSLSQNHARFETESFQFTTKLIDGKFPDYNRVIPVDIDKEVFAKREQLKQSLSRIAILSNEKYRGIRLTFGNNILSIQANNPDREEAEEEVEVQYQDEKLEIGFNVSYLLDVLSVLDSEEVIFKLKDGNSSCILCAVNDELSKYVVMPMRL